MKKKIMKKKILTLLVSFTLVSGILTGCGSEPASNNQANTDTSTSDQTTNDGKKLTISQITNTSTIDSDLASMDVDLGIVRVSQEGLYKNGETAYELGVAEKEELSEDKLTRTYTIRSDAKWSDGQPVTANDFEYAWKRLANPDTGSEYSYMLSLADIKNATEVTSGELPVDELGIKAIDEKTLEVQTNSYLPYFPELMAFPSFSPIREDAVEQYGDQYGLSADTTIYSGVYKVSSWTPGEETVTLVRNENYYDQSVTNIDNLSFQTITETQTGIMAYENGDIDYLSLSGDQIDQYKDSAEYHTNVIGQLFYIEPNLSNKYLKNENIRYALAVAINKQEICDNILKNGSVPANDIVASNIGIKSDGQTFREFANKEYLVYDSELAVERWNKGLEELGVSELSFELLYDDTPGQADIAQYLQESYQKLLPGLSITLQQQPKSNRLELMTAGKFDLGLTKWGPDYHDPSTMMAPFVTDASYNHAGFSDKEYDKFVERAGKEDVMDEDARFQDFAKAEAILLEGAYTIPIYHDAGASLIKSDVSLPLDVGGLYYLYHFAKRN